VRAEAYGDGKSAPREPDLTHLRVPSLRPQGPASEGPWDPPSGRFFLPWLLLAGVCIVVMWSMPGSETIPYHVAWVGFALAYGSTTWSTRRAVLGLLAFTAVTGGILCLRAVQGAVAWPETAEIPLMTGIMALLVWHIRRRQDSLSTVTAMADRERGRAAAEEQLTRLTSHEMRTPLTIAGGYVQMLRAKEEDPESQRDLDVITDELDRLRRATDRLLWAMRLQGSPTREHVDVDALLLQTTERWATVAHRHWVLEAHAGAMDGSPERLRVCLDTLVENAVRYTRDGDTIRVFGARQGARVRLGVADSGPGLRPEQLEMLNQSGAPGGVPDPLARDELSQTGLGLALVRSVAEALDGRTLAGAATEGGALVAIEFTVGQRDLRALRTLPLVKAVAALGEPRPAAGVLPG